MSQLLWRPGFTRRQHSGALGLFGHGSHSGAQHEIDGAGEGPETGAWIESKARTTLNKSDVAVFQLKCFDFYRAAASEYPEQTAGASWWPLLVSSEPKDLETDLREARARRDTATGELGEFESGLPDIAEAEERVHRDIAPVLRATVLKRLEQVTGGRYTDCRVNPEPNHPERTPSQPAQSPARPH